MCLKYCQYSVKHYSINQSIFQSTKMHLLNLNFCKMIFFLLEVGDEDSLALYNCFFVMCDMGNGLMGRLTTCGDHSREHPALPVFDRLPMIPAVLEKDVCTVHPASGSSAPGVVTWPVPHQHPIVIIRVDLKLSESTFTPETMSICSSQFSLNIKHCLWSHRNSNLQLRIQL